MTGQSSASLLTSERVDKDAADIRYLSQKNIVPPSNILAFVGDSITAGSGTTTNTNKFASIAPVVLGSARADQYLRVYATGGFTSQQILDIWVPAACASDAGIVHFAGGTNDCDKGMSVARYAAIVQQVYAKIRTAGKLMSISHIPPRNSSATAQWRKDRAAFNEWISRWAARVGVPVADTTVITDPTTGHIRASYNFDGTHPNDLGHAKVGEAVAAAIATILPVQQRRQVLSPDVNLLPSSTMGTTPGAGLPTNWGEATGGTGDAATYSTVTDTTSTLAEGLWLQMAWAPSTAGGTRTVKYTGSMLALGTNFNIGDVLEVSMAVQVTDVSGFQAAIEASTATLTLNQFSGSGSVQNTLLRPVKTTKLGRIAARFLGPSTGAPSIGWTVVLPVGVSMQLRFGEVLVRNLTTLGLAGQYPLS